MRIVSAILELLTPSQRRHYYLLQAYFVFAAVVQVVGVASVAPFIALVSNPGIIHTNALTRQVFIALHFASETQFLMAFAVALMALIVVSNAVVAVATWLIVAFSLNLGVAIQKDIYRGFLRRDYVDLARTNSGNLVAVITADTPRFIYMVVQPLLTLISQAIIVVVIVGGLMWYSFWVAVSAGTVIGGGYAVVYFMVRRRLVKHGDIAWTAYTAKQRLLTESLGGIKEIRLVGSEHRYEKQFNTVTHDGLRSDTVIGLLGDLPKFILESIAFCALLGLGIYLLSAAKRPQDIVGFLSLYAMAGYKLLPAAQNVFKSASQIRGNASIVDQLRPDIIAGRAAHSPAPASEAGRLATTHNIRWNNVSFSYPNSDAPAIKDITLEIQRNAITVIVGPSGAGKSTFADLLLGLLRPSTGTITVDGHSITEDVRSWQQSIGYVPQNIFILDDTVAANVGFGSRDPIDLAKVTRASSLASIDHFVESRAERYQYIVGERGSRLSGGQRQRIGIARALYHDADVLVLDEATSALDTITEREILLTLAELKRNKTVVLIAHRIGTIKAADQVIFIKDGFLADVGTYEQLVSVNDEFRAYIAAGVNDRSQERAISGAAS